MSKPYPGARTMSRLSKRKPYFRLHARPVGRPAARFDRYPGIIRVETHKNTNTLHCRVCVYRVLVRCPTYKWKTCDTPGRAEK